MFLEDKYTEIDEKRNNFIKYYNRLIDFRYKKLQQPKNIYEDGDDVASVAASDATGLTSYTYAFSVASAQTYTSSYTA